jgi:hypothetical protein
VVAALPATGTAAQEVRGDHAPGVVDEQVTPLAGGVLREEEAGQRRRDGTEAREGRGMLVVAQQGAEFDPDVEPATGMTDRTDPPPGGRVRTRDVVVAASLLTFALAAPVAVVRFDFVAEAEPPRHVPVVGSRRGLPGRPVVPGAPGAREGGGGGVIVVVGAGPGAARPIDAVPVAAGAVAASVGAAAPSAAARPAAAGAGAAARPAAARPAVPGPVVATTTT